MKKVDLKGLVLLFLFSVLAFFAGGLVFNLLSPPVYGQTANAWNLHRVGTDLNFYYGVGGANALILKSGGDMQARIIRDIDNPTSFYIDPNSISVLNQLQINTPNAAGLDGTAPLILNRGYGTVGDYQDIVFGGGSGNAPNRAAIIRSIANAPGEGGLVFLTQTGAGDAANHESMRIQGNGYVGIGNASPSQQLHVGKNSGGAGDGVIRSSTNNNAGGARDWDFGAGYTNFGNWGFNIKDIGANAIRLTIGLDGKLDYAGPMRIQGGNGAPAAGSISSGDSGLQVGWNGSGGWGEVNLYSIYNAQGAAANPAFLFSSYTTPTTPVNHLSIMKNGFVGVGTSLPNAKFEISQPSGYFDPQNPHLRLDYADYEIMKMYMDGAWSTVMNTQNSPGTGHIALVPKTNVGIGTTTPNGRLDIHNPGGNGDGIVIAPQMHGDNTSTIQSYIDATLGGWANRTTYAGGCCNNLLLQPDVGNVGIGTTAPTAKLDVQGNVRISGSITQEAWIPCTFQNGASNYGQGWDTCNYFKDKNGIVHLKGLLNVGAGQPWFTLPAGYRPAGTLIFLCSSSNGPIRCDVTPTGGVAVNTTANAWISISGITFRADQ